MLNKLEIYPYQRISEKPGAGKRVPGRQVFKMGGKTNLDLSGIMAQLAGYLKSLLTMDKLLPAVLIVFMSRAFVLGELLPFVYACLVAFGYRHRQRSLLLAICAIAGFISVLSGLSLWSGIITLLVLLGVINYVKIPADKMWWGLPLISIAIIFISKTLCMFFSAISFYQEMVIIFEALIAGVLTFVFLVAADCLKQQKPLATFSFEDIIAFMILGIGVIMGLDGIELGGLSIAAILCRLGILIAAFLWGSGGGTMVGVMTGIIPSVSSSIFAQSLGIYAISGLLAGIFRHFGRLGVIIGYMLGTLALSLFIAETQATILGMWETGVACLIFLLLPSSLKEKLPLQSLGPIGSTGEKELILSDIRIKDTARNRIEHLAGVFDELSSTFTEETKSSHQAGDSAYLTYLYDEISANFCGHCSRYEECWGRNCYTTSQEILDIFSIIETTGEVNYEECPVNFRRRCIYGREMLAMINHLFDNLRINEYWSGRLEESRNLVSRQLQGISQVMKNLAQEIEVKTTVDIEMRQHLLKESRKRGVDLKDISPVRSGQQLYINTITPSCVDGCKCEMQIAPVISGLLGEKMEVCHKKCPRLSGKGQCEFTLTRAFNYHIISGAVQVGKEEVCGDSFTIATLKEGKELVALSDGMGVGEKACSESQAAVRLLENLLSSGFDRETALKTINSVLILRSTQESFATLDMLMIDLYTAEVDFIKVGSAPSFIKRGKKVGIITSNSLPIGILDNLDVVSEKRTLYPRDILVMLSDGVLEASRDLGGDLWMQEFLADIDENDPQLLAEMIINKALSLCQGQPRDDMTVICMYVDLD
jgi:stage II sporulation protein E